MTCESMEEQPLPIYTYLTTYLTYIHTVHPYIEDSLGTHLSHDSDVADADAALAITCAANASTATLAFVAVSAAAVDVAADALTSPATASTAFLA